MQLSTTMVQIGCGICALLVILTKQNCNKNTLEAAKSMKINNYTNETLARGENKGYPNQIVIFKKKLVRSKILKAFFL